MSSKDKLTYLALGGAGEIGMNMYVYGYGPVGKQRFILVDAGVTFPDMESTPGVDLIMADPAFIAERADRLEAIFITHAHEDHVGAIGHLLPQLQAPVYCRAFTGLIAGNKLDRAGQDLNQIHVVGAWPETVTVGPFEVGFLPVSHSIPEASGLVIDTPAGRIVHTGDFKLDPSPLVGDPYEPAVLEKIGAAGVKALVCDSTNVFSPHPGRSEAEIRPAIEALMKEAKGMVVATTFASNIARLKTLAQAAHASGRTVAVLGRAMNTMIQAGFSSGVLKDFPPIVDARDADEVPRAQLFVLATGSQGERRAASAQLAGGSYMGLSLKEGDTFLFSSKTIPGNEVGVARILNQLSEAGVDVIDDSSGLYHVSGHANRPDLAKVHELLKPANVIPMHGEHRHLRAHVALAAERQIHGVIAPNGTVVDLTGDTAAIIDHVETGRVYLDGAQLIGAMDGIVRDRIRMATRGHAIVSVMLEADGSPIGGAWVETLGLPDGDREEIGALLERALEDALGKAASRVLDSDEALEKLIVKTVQSEGQNRIGKKPLVTVMINRFDEE
ncbi:ribonuclease J [Algicella marina]|uniref:MBL fold metallo-hydrolase n=1 Tax=Algicella marina TaxID=2683284 RepID=A0A6P1SZ36_9RHOB|nr:ribonuclease J [Algicella marina]QHQ34633.1 MBL fold metallo-hydrolase [Algicella marina]